jgi:hypothetical protein
MDAADTVVMRAVVISAEVANGRDFMDRSISNGRRQTSATLERLIVKSRYAGYVSR